jgi:hypothetical protein
MSRYRPIQKTRFFATISTPAVRCVPPWEYTTNAPWALTRLGRRGRGSRGPGAGAEFGFEHQDEREY